MAPVKNPNTSTNNKKPEKQKQQPTREDSKSVPIERELKDLHDYLQTTLAQATKQQQQRQQQQTLHQQNPTLNGQKATVTSGFDLKPLAESQRYCFPSTSYIQQQQNHQEQTPLEPRQLPLQQIEEHILPINLLDLAACLTASAAASSEAVTIPTTTVHATSSAAATFSNLNLSESVLLQQRLQLIQQFLSLTEKTKSSAAKKNHPNSFMVHEINHSLMDHEVVVNSTSLEDVALSEMSDRAQSIQSLHSIETPTPENTPSYDELQHRLETSNRNIQNIQEQQQQLKRLQNTAKQHLSDMEELRQNAGKLSFVPGNGQQQNGDSTTNGEAPDYESIEQVHTDMATLVGRMKNLTSFIQDQNELSNLLGDDGPEILAEQEELQRKLESLRTQRDEMRSLVGELQDINRNAEKSAHDRKEHSEEEEMEERKTHQASPASHERFVPVEYSRVVPIELLQAAANYKQNDAGVSAATSSAGGEEDNAEAALLIQQKTADIEAMKSQLKRLKDMMETVNLIESRTARDPKDIGRTPPPQSSLTRDGRSQSSSLSYDRERTPLASSSSRETSVTVVDDGSNDAFIARKVRMLNEVTSDLRAQAESLQTERDRIKALKDEIIRRKEQAAAAAQLGEDALKRSSLTPTPTPLSRQVQQLLDEDSLEDRHQLQMEYEVKKKEFELLCQRLNARDGEVAPSINQSNNSADTPILRNSKRQDIVSEADDEAEEDLLNDTNFARKYFATAPLPRSVDVTASTSSTQVRCAQDSLNSTAASSNASATRVSTAATTTAANSTHDGAASLEAASLQSGSSHSFSLPPPMASMSSWPPMPPPPLPSSWNPHYYYGLAMPPPPAPPSSHTSLHTAQSYTLPPHYTPPTSTVAGVPPVPLPNSNEFICSAGSAATVGAVSTTATTAAAQLAADPVLLQQFVQTQQMLINSVCQCNQMLWHQQREIDALNNTIHILQDRLLALTGPSAADLSFNLRAESVPPPTLSGALPNNLYASINRAQSEQPPTAFLPNVAITGGAQPRSAFANYQQQQQLYQRQRGIITSGLGVGGGAGPGAYNYNTETQQQNASSSIYATLNNAAAQQQPPPPPPPSHFNNEAAPQSPMSASAGGPGPIFMHHHNNSIHQNNANLRTQNHHANNLQQQQNHNNLAGGNTLNNQVPPGNRANNYWDNFRSYSRQNLLSTNSNKSNEEQQQIQQQLQQQQQQHQQQQQQSHEPNLYQTQRATAATLRNLHLYHQSNAAAPPPPHPPPREFLGSLNWHENDIDLYDNYNIIDNDELSAAYAPASASSSSNIRNMNNVNFGNSPHYQRNKVPAKQTCRPTIGLASTLNQNRNRLEQSSVHLTHNIEGEYERSQQQQEELQQLFRSRPFTHQNQQLRFSLLPTASSTSTATREAAANAALNTAHNLRNDFLLRTVDINDDYDDYRQSSILTAAAGIENIATDSFNVNGVVVDDDDDDDDDDDTTSEEIKRNLLVNALKNDKFTTKFYESIKEDVFRRLESMLLEKENSSSSCTNDGWQQQQQYSESHQQQPKQFLTQLCNNVESSSTGATATADISASERGYNLEQRSRDPLRKLYLNARMGNQQQQQQHQPLCFPQQLPLSQLKLVLYEQEENNNADTESNNADNETLALENLIAENEKPEDENEHCNNIASDVNVIAAATAATSNWRQNIIGNVRHLEQLARNPTTTNKKRKNQQQQQRSEKEEAIACSLLVSAAEENKTKNEMYSTTIPATSSSSNNNSTQTPILTSPNYDLINYIITRIRNQTHANTAINDTLLVEIAKLTATSAQNAAAATATTSKLSLTTSPPNISPKRIYAKIKKMSIPRQRDEFLRWYQNYLETLFVVEEYQQQHEGNNTAGISKSCKGQQQQQHSRNLPLKSNIPSTQKNENESDAIKTVNSNNNNNNLNCNKPNIFLEHQKQQHNVAAHNANTTTANLQINDADLAEADQISANTSLNGGASQTNHSHHGLQPEDEEEEDDQRAYAGHIANAMSQTINKFKQENSAAAEVKHELEELENNENPDEEGATAAAAEAAIAATTASIADACTLILNEAHIIAGVVADDELLEQELLQLHNNIAAAGAENQNGVFNTVEEEEMLDNEFLKRDSIA